MIRATMSGRLAALLLLSATLSHAGCAGSMNLGVSSPRIERPSLSSTQVFRAAKRSLDELGVVDEASMDLGLITGHIPPFAVKAVMERGAPAVRLHGVRFDRGAWQRDSLKKEWRLDRDGKEHCRKGVESLADAVEAWRRAIEARLGQTGS